MYLCRRKLKTIEATDMKLKEILSGQFNAAEWEQKGYELPKFDIQAVRERTCGGH